MINDAQHGFPHGRSCVSQLLTTLHPIGQVLNNNIQMDVIFLDFVKAFDSVDHGILLAKLGRYSISGNIHNWFCSYLRGRTQQVAVEGVALEWSSVTSGIPHGMYADDTKLYRDISNEDCTCSQSALSNA